MPEAENPAIETTDDLQRAACNSNHREFMQLLNDFGPSAADDVEEGAEQYMSGLEYIQAALRAPGVTKVETDAQGNTVHKPDVRMSVNFNNRVPNPNATTDARTRTIPAKEALVKHFIDKGPFSQAEIEKGWFIDDANEAPVQKQAQKQEAKVSPAPRKETGSMSSTEAAAVLREVRELRQEMGDLKIALKWLFAERSAETKAVDAYAEALDRNLQVLEGKVEKIKPAPAKKPRASKDLPGL